MTGISENGRDGEAEGGPVGDGDGGPATNSRDDSGSGDTPTDLRTQLYNRIAATVGEAPSAPGQGRGNVDPPPREAGAGEGA